MLGGDGVPGGEDGGTTADVAFGFEDDEFCGEGGIDAAKVVQEVGSG